jgi:hypothetical protein
MVPAKFWGKEREKGVWGAFKHYFFPTRLLAWAFPPLRIGWEWVKAGEQYVRLHMKRAVHAGEAAYREFDLEIANSNEAKNALTDIKNILKKEALGEADIGEIFRRMHRALLYINTKRESAFDSQLRELIAAFERLVALSAVETATGKKLLEFSVRVEEYNEVAQKDESVLQSELLNVLKGSVNDTLRHVASDSGHTNHNALKTKLLEYGRRAHDMKSATERFAAKQVAISGKLASRTAQCNVTARRAAAYLKSLEEGLTEGAIEGPKDPQVTAVLNRVRAIIQQTMTFIDETKVFVQELGALNIEIDAIDAQVFSIFKDIDALEGELKRDDAIPGI